MDFYNNTEHILETIELEMNLKTNKDTHISSRFKNLFMSMVDPNVYNRTTVMAALHEYQNILVDSGILDTHSKPHSKMLQQTVDNIASIRKTSSSVAKEISTISLPLSPAQKEEIRESVPKRLCPEGKEYNKRTKRCVKKCKEGSRRNKNFRCVKIPKSKTQKKKKSLGPCSEGKERNPNTNRCVKKCKPGYKRNESFKCVKSKN
jgi:transglutaminase/protease-like cytokinesis protein 3